MSFKYAINTYPTRITQGTQYDSLTLVNNGPATVYVSDDSSVTPKVDMAVDVGGSFQVYPGQVVWAVCDTNLTATLNVLNNTAERFAYGQPVGKLLFESYSAPFTYTWEADATLASQFSSVLVVIQPKAPSGVGVGGDLEVYCGQGDFATVTDIGLVPYGGNVMGAAWPTDVGASPRFESVTYAVVFPLNQFSFTVWASTDGTIPGMKVYGLRTTVPQTIVNNQGFSSINSGGFGAMYAQTGNTYTVNAGSVAASTNATLPLPAVPGPVRVVVTATQTGAGAFTATPATYSRITTGVGIGPVFASAWRAFDSALISSTTAGSKFGSAQYGVWPTSATGVTISTAAGVTLSNLIVTVITAGQ